MAAEGEGARVLRALRGPPALLDLPARRAIRAIRAMPVRLVLLAPLALPALLDPRDP